MLKTFILVLKGYITVSFIILIFNNSGPPPQKCADGLAEMMIGNFMNVGIAFIILGIFTFMGFNL